jgi:nickel-dependent lactate racemase
MPGGWRVFVPRGKRAEPLTNHESEVKKILDEPVPVGSAKPFDKIFSVKRTVAIVVPDKTRKAGVDKVLPGLLDRLHRIGIKDSSVVIVFALGIHPKQTDRERESIVGNGVFGRYRCIDHDCRGDGVEVGAFAGEPLLINREVAGSDGVIVISGVKPHYLAGFGGGRKSILPGIASYGNALAYHRLSLDTKSPGRHPCVGPFMLDGNPMHEQAVEAARMVPVDFYLTTVVDAEGSICFVSGGAAESFYTACDYSKRVSMLEIERKGDVVIASCGGYPGDVNFIQAHKSLDSACMAVKGGGVVILVAECREGFGNDTFLNWFDHGDADSIGMALRDRFEINGQTAMAVREKSSAVKILMLSELNDADVKRMGITPIKTFAEGIAIALKIVGNDASVLILQNGGTSLPVVSG